MIHFIHDWSFKRQIKSTHTVVRMWICSKDNCDKFKIETGYNEYKRDDDINPDTVTEAIQGEKVDMINWKGIVKQRNTKRKAWKQLANEDTEKEYCIGCGSLKKH